MRNRWIPSFVTLLLIGSLAHGQVVSKTFMVEMGDGVKLATDVYWPENGTPPYPSILIRTPYGKAQGKALTATMCPLGYVIVAQDLRGRFESEGDAVPVFGHEGIGEHRDGHETIEWITRQKWSSGKVAMWGGSASAIVQNMAAPGAPDALKGQFVLEAFSDYYHQFAYQGGVWRKSIMEGWLKSQNLDGSHLPLFLGHPYYDDFWKSLSPERYAEKVIAPGIFMGGWYDVFAQGTINSFTTIQEKGGSGARGRSYLVMGPISHGLFHDRLYRDATKAPIHTFLPLEFYNYWLKGEDKEKIAPLKPVHYYVMGDLSDPAAPGNRWRSADAWPPPADVTPFHFGPDGSLKRKQAPTGKSQLTYKFEPANPVPTMGGQELYPPVGPTDQRPVESRPDVLLFTSEVLTEPLEVTGRIYGKLYVSSDCKDTDFTVKLCDVYPDGRSMLVTDGIRRASLRNSYEHPEFLEKGKVYEVEVDLWSTSLIFNKGHRIRIAVSSSNHPRFEVNANTGEPHPAAGKTKVAANTIHLSKEHPSHILLPIYRGSEP